MQFILVQIGVVDRFNAMLRSTYIRVRMSLDCFHMIPFNLYSLGYPSGLLFLVMEFQTCFHQFYFSTTTERVSCYYYMSKVHGGIIWVIQIVF